MVVIYQQWNWSSWQSFRLWDLLVFQVICSVVSLAVWQMTMCGCNNDVNAVKAKLQEFEPASCRVYSAVPVVCSQWRHWFSCASVLKCSRREPRPVCERVRERDVWWKLMMLDMLYSYNKTISVSSKKIKLQPAGIGESLSWPIPHC